MVPLNTAIKENVSTSSSLPCLDQHREKGGTTLIETLEIMSQERL